MAYVVVAGGTNVDIGGRSYAPLVAGDSNPGRVTVSLGGVGRNIAHDLALLGVETVLLTALGGDTRAEDVARSCAALGIDLSHALRVPEGRTSTYLYLSGPGGEMALAVSDMDLCERLTPAYFAAQQAVLDGAALVVLDANLPQASLCWLAEHCRAPLFADPVSTVKGEKLRPILDRLHTLKPNRLEAERLTGVPIRDEAGLAAAARALLALGPRRVAITLGADGVLCADERGLVHVPAVPAAPRDVTGAGDAFTAALAWAYLEGEDLAESARLAAAAAALTVEHEETNDPDLSAAAVRDRRERNEA